MKNQIVARASLHINASPEKVWVGLTNPEIVKKYFFGVDVISDWKVGSPIRYKGIWEGKEFIDKGNVLRSEANKLLVCNYWSTFSGLPDEPENYQNVIYQLQPDSGGTTLSITQDNIPTEKSRQHTEQNWTVVLNKLKELLESETNN